MIVVVQTQDTREVVEATLMLTLAMDGVIDTAGGGKDQEVLLSTRLEELSQEIAQSLEGVQGILVKGGLFE